MKAYWIGHHIRHREVNISFKIMNKEPLRIGSGRGVRLSSPVDLPVLKITIGGVEKPYIPGSSLKGLFRSFMDTFIRSHNGWTCPGAGEGTCMNNVCKIHNVDELVKNGRYDKLAEALWKGLCLSCKVFGSSGYRSKVLVSDGFPAPGSNIRLGVKPGIAIDRKTGAAARGALYQVEYVEPGAVFDASLRISDAPNYVLGIIGLALIELNEGRLKIGGFKTRGFGRVEIKDLNISINFYTSIGGEIGKEQVILKPMDDIDKELVYELPSSQRSSGNNSVVLSEEKAWDLIYTIVKETVYNRDLVNRIVNAHRPSWVGRNAF